MHEAVDTRVDESTGILQVEHVGHGLEAETVGLIDGGRINVRRDLGNPAEIVINPDLHQVHVARGESLDRVARTVRGRHLDRRLLEGLE